jgi:DNA-binding transcriptional ArsR family regulator
MARLFPSTSDVDVESAPRVVGLDDEDADDLLSALSSRTARRMLAELHESPSNAATLADRVDTSLQNVQYHLGRLRDAGAVEVVDTVYSEKGREMKVYAPADRPLVVVAADSEQSDGLASVLKRLFAGVGLVGVLSLLVQWLATRSATQSGATSDAAAMESTRVAAETAAGGIPPGLLFFLGGVAVLGVWFAVWYLRRR